MNINCISVHLLNMYLLDCPWSTFSVVDIKLSIFPTLKLKKNQQKELKMYYLLIKKLSIVNCRKIKKLRKRENGAQKYTQQSPTTATSKMLIQPKKRTNFSNNLFGLWFFHLLKFSAQSPFNKWHDKTQDNVYGAQ